MPKKQVLGLLFVILGCLLFAIRGAHDERITLNAVDFKGVYGGAECLLHGCNPYSEPDIRQMYAAAGGNPASWYQPANYNADYLPTALFFAIPFAFLRWGPAHILWIMLIMVSYSIAAVLAWDLNREDAPLLNGVLIGAFVASSTLLIFGANPAGIAVSCCVVGVWSILKERFVVAGICCFALSLLLKPHDSGLIWLYFLLAGANYRKRALQILAVAFLVAVPSLMWVSFMPASSHWIHDLRTNLHGISAPGYPSDPSPQNSDAYNITDLQAAISVFEGMPKTYDVISYAVCGALLLFWTIAVLRYSSGPEKHLMAIAAAACLTLLPIYHRAYDARTLLLLFPALAFLAKRNRTAGLFAVILTVAGIVVTWHTYLHHVTARFHVSTETLSARIASVLLLRPIPCILFCLAVFYLIMLWRAGYGENRPGCSQNRKSSEFAPSGIEADPIRKTASSTSTLQRIVCPLN